MGGTNSRHWKRDMEALDRAINLRRQEAMYRKLKGDAMWKGEIKHMSDGRTLVYGRLRNMPFHAYVVSNDGREEFLGAYFSRKMAEENIDTLIKKLNKDQD